MLGRHTFKIQTQFAKDYEASLKRNGIEGRRFDYLQDDAYCETLMEKLGFGPMEAMDFSGFEGATILHDLNKPPAPELENQFDFIFDGGTIEHVFNVVHDCRAMPKIPGGKVGEQPFRDPAATGRRLRMKGKIGTGRTYLYYEIEKTEDSHPPTYALQSDYEVKWQGSDMAGTTRFEKEDA